MSYHAGAGLANLECYQINSLIKDYNGPACAYVAGPFGGYTANNEGMRFIECDYWSGQMMLEFYNELQSGKGPVFLKLDHLGEEVLHSRLPGICELAITFAQTDPVKEPIPVVPTCHYMMGGIPTNVHGQAIKLSGGHEGEEVSLPGRLLVEVASLVGLVEFLQRAGSPVQPAGILLFTVCQSGNPLLGFRPVLFDHGATCALVEQVRIRVGLQPVVQPRPVLLDATNGGVPGDALAGFLPQGIIAQTMATAVVLEPLPGFYGVFVGPSIKTVRQ